MWRRPFIVPAWRRVWPGDGAEPDELRKLVGMRCNYALSHQYLGDVDCATRTVVAGCWYVYRSNALGLLRTRRAERRRSGEQLRQSPFRYTIPDVGRQERPEETRVEDVLAAHDSVPLERVVGPLEDELPNLDEGRFTPGSVDEPLLRALLPEAALPIDTPDLLFEYAADGGGVELVPTVRAVAS